MKNKHLKPGVAVDVRGASDEDVQAVIDACLAAGAKRGVDCYSAYVKWGIENAVWLSRDYGSYKTLTIDQAIGRESEVEKNDWENLGYTGMIPNADQWLEYADSSNPIYSRCKYIGVNSVGSKKFAVLFVPSVAEYVESKIGSELKFRPLKTEKEKFVERFIESWEEIDGLDLEPLVKKMYDKGLRFIE